MEGLVKKYQQKFKRVREEMESWNTLHLHLVSQSRNAASIIDRLQAIQNSSNYGRLNTVGGIKDSIYASQLCSLQSIMLTMNKTLEELHGVVSFLEKMYRDARQQVKGGSNQLTAKMLHQRIGIKPTLVDCIDGLMLLHDMHKSEFLLKSSLVSALSEVTLKPSSSDLSALQQLMVDQPNILKEEVQLIYDIIFAEDIC